MKNWKCILGLHKSKAIGTQSVAGVVGGFSMVPLQRIVTKCQRENCGKVNFIGLDIATNAHLDESLDWQPKLNL